MYNASGRVFTFQDNRIVRLPYVAEYTGYMWFGGVEEKATGFVDEYVNRVAVFRTMAKVF